MRKMGIGVAALATTTLLLAGCAGGSTPAATETEEAPIDASGITLTVWTDENRNVERARFPLPLPSVQYRLRCPATVDR